MVSVVGIPLDENSSYLRGASEAPAHIRTAFRSPSANTCNEQGEDLLQNQNWRDEGDLTLSPNAIKEIEAGIKERVQQGNKVLSLGGDHSITYPIIKAIASKYRNLNILHIDAHADLYDTFEGNRYSHACPFARIMEEKLATRLVQVGVRTITPHQREQAIRFGVEMIEMKDWTEQHRFAFDGPLYISLDLDALDPAFAPGVSHHEPGGFSTRQLLTLIQHIEATVIGADMVELNPSRDIHDITAMVAAKLFKELLTKML